MQGYQHCQNVVAGKRKANLKYLKKLPDGHANDYFSRDNKMQLINVENINIFKEKINIDH